MATAASVVLAFVFISYFVPPRDLARRLLSLDVRTAGDSPARRGGRLITLMDFLFTPEILHPPSARTDICKAC